MDKVAAKRRSSKPACPMPRFDVVSADRLAELVRQWCPPAVLKPIADGSSVDITIARDSATLDERLTALVGK
jgi:biotin carboxylase